MRKRVVLGCLLVIGLAVSTTANAAKAHRGSDIDYVAIMNGNCTKLVFAGQDGSSRCIGKLVNSVFHDGRTGFLFTVGDLAVVTFSGVGQNQVKDSANVASQPIDNVIFGPIGDGTSPNTLKAAGLCTYTNPYAGSARVKCSAHTSKGTFEASFTSDGQPPDIKRF